MAITSDSSQPLLAVVEKNLNFYSLLMYTLKIIILLRTTTKIYEISQSDKFYCE